MSTIPGLDISHAVGRRLGFGGFGPARDKGVGTPPGYSALYDMLSARLADATGAWLYARVF